MEISKNIPFPKRSTKGRPDKYPFKELEIGDSFTINKSEQMSVYSCVNYYNKINSTTIKVKTGKDDSGQLRCWRIE